MINQGDIYWVDLDEPRDSSQGYRRPCVVVQNHVLNHSRLRTTIVCLTTSNLRRAAAPGNLPLQPGEGGLQLPSVVNVSQLLTIDKANLTDYIGTIGAARMREIVRGIALILEPRDPVL